VTAVSFWLLAKRKWLNNDMFLQICTSGAEAPSFLCFIAARLKPCPDTNPRFCATPGAEPDSGSGFAARLEAAPFKASRISKCRTPSKRFVQ
jgi:hypothetical protein